MSYLSGPLQIFPLFLEIWKILLTTVIYKAIIDSKMETLLTMRVQINLIKYIFCMSKKYAYLRQSTNVVIYVIHMNECSNICNTYEKYRVF